MWWTKNSILQTFCLTIKVPSCVHTRTQQTAKWFRRARRCRTCGAHARIYRDLEMVWTCCVHLDDEPTKRATVHPRAGRVMKQGRPSSDVHDTCCRSVPCAMTRFGRAHAQGEAPCSARRSVYAMMLFMFRNQYLVRIIQTVGKFEKL